MEFRDEDFDVEKSEANQIGSRHMSLPQDLKSLYVKWLDDEIQKVSAKQERLAMVYTKALDNLRRYDAEIGNPNELLKIKGIGNTIKNLLKQRLSAHCEEIGAAMPDDSITDGDNDKQQRIRIRALGKDDDADSEKPKKKRKYVPKRRSGAYAILLGLLEGNGLRGGMSKDELTKGARKYCDNSFHANPSTREFHSAWSAMKTLLDRELVIEEGRPKRYILTADGETMAELLKRTDGVVFEDEEEYERRKHNKTKRNDDIEANNSCEISANLSELMKRTRSSSKADNVDHYPTPHPKASALPEFVEPARKTHSISISSPSESSKDTPIPRDQALLHSSKDNIIRARWNKISYEVWEPSSYDIVLIIDHREVRSQKDREFFANKLTERGIETDIRQLSLSDMLWIARHKISKRECVLNFILERKRLDDFAMSIMDNRFLEQKNRLKKTGSKHIYYLVEETSANDTSVNRMAEAIRTSVWLTMIYNDFHVKRTKNSDETVDWLQSMTSVIKNCYSTLRLLVISPRDLKCQEDYEASLTLFRNQFERTDEIECCHRFDCFQEVMGKTSLMTVKELYLRALMLNKGVSLEKALSIQAKFPTLKQLLLAYKKCKTREDAKMMIANTMKDEPGNRKIGKALSETLWKTFGECDNV